MKVESKLESISHALFRQYYEKKIYLINILDFNDVIPSRGRITLLKEIDVNEYEYDEALDRGNQKDRGKCIHILIHKNVEVYKAYSVPF